MNARGMMLLLCALIGSALWTAHPALYAQAPTEEPTKRPYIFPTPIFIPTYPNDTPLPPRATPTAPLVRPTSETTSEEQTYVVQPGDSLWTIAQKMYGNGAKYPLIAQANDITLTTRLRTGMVLKIPGGSIPVTPTATRVPATPTATLLPTSSPTPTPSVTPTLAPRNDGMAGWLDDTAATVLRVLAALCALAGSVSAVSAYLMYARAKRLQLIEEGKPPLRLS